MEQPEQQPQLKDMYCGWRLQLDKRQARGEIHLEKLESCERCNGYNIRCASYRPMRIK